MISVDSTTAKGLVDGVYPAAHPDPAKAGQPFVFPENVVGAIASLTAIGTGVNNYVRFEYGSNPTAADGIVLITTESLHLGFTDQSESQQDLIDEKIKSAKFITTEPGVEATLEVTFVINACSNPPEQPTLPWPRLLLTSSIPDSIAQAGTLAFSIIASAPTDIDSASLAAGIQLIRPDGSRQAIAQQSANPSGDSLSILSDYLSDLSAYTAADNGAYRIVALTSITTLDGNAIPAELELAAFTVEIPIATGLYPIVSSTNGYSGNYARKDDWLFATPRRSPKFLAINVFTGEIRQPDVGFNSNFKAAGGPTIVGDKVYYPMDATPSLFALSTDTFVVTQMAVSGGSGNLKLSGTGTLTPNDVIYWGSISTHLCKLDTTTGVAERISIPNIGSRRYRGGAIAPNGKIYFPPLTGSDVMILDTANDTISYLSVAGYASGGNRHAGAILVHGDYLYCLPFEAVLPNGNSAYLKIRWTDNTYELLDTGVAGPNPYYGPTLAADGKLYCTPRALQPILVITPGTTDSLSTIALTPENNALLAGPPVADGQNVWFTPRTTRFARKLDTATGVVTLVSMTSNTISDGWAGNSQVHKGVFSLVPKNSSDVHIQRV